MGLIPGSGRSPGGGHGNPLQYSCLENLMDRATWRPTVHRLQSQTWLKPLSTHACGLVRSSLLFRGCRHVEHTAHWIVITYLVIFIWHCIDSSLSMRKVSVLICRFSHRACVEPGELKGIDKCLLRWIHAAISHTDVIIPLGLVFSRAAQTICACGRISSMSSDGHFPSFLLAYFFRMEWAQRLISQMEKHHWPNPVIAVPFLYASNWSRDGHVIYFWPMRYKGKYVEGLGNDFSFY